MGLWILGMQKTLFYKQAEFVLQILPFLKSENIFALKGGTALNFFIRDLPRLSVDIDLNYLPVLNREKSLSDISNHLKQAAERICNKLTNIQVTYKYAQNSKTIVGLIFLRNNVSVKVEPNLVIRGSVHESIEKTLCKSAMDMFGVSISFLTLSIEDLYGGKICAALDRQHPRDLFDINLLFANEGLNEKIRKTFIVYLLSHPRPMVELLNPNLINIKKTYENEFYGMTLCEISLEELLNTRKELIKIINRDLTEKERRFLLSVKTGEPKWDLFDWEHIKFLPAVKWKIHNIKQMEPKKHKQAVDRLKRCLEL